MKSAFSGRDASGRIDQLQLRAGCDGKGRGNRDGRKRAKVSFMGELLPGLQRTDEARSV